MIRPFNESLAFSAEINENLKDAFKTIQAYSVPAICW